MKDYTYQNTLVSKKELKQLLSWSFTKYNCIQAGFLADELKYLGFKYATTAGISISIEDLKVPIVKHKMLQKAYIDVLNTEKIYLQGKITEVERFQKVIDIWSITSESLKSEVISYFNEYDPLNSVYIMAFSGARGNISQVRQLVGMRGLMANPSGEILKLPIIKNFREGLSITDYLMSGYGARKGIVDTALKTANSGYLTRRLIDVAQDIIIREKDCNTKHSCLLLINKKNSKNIFTNLLGRLLSKDIYHPQTNKLIAKSNQQITPKLIEIFKTLKIKKFYIRSPLTCRLYRSICQKCYGWDLASQNMVDIGEAIGIIAGQSIGEPGTQLTMRTFHTGGIFTSELRQQIKSSINGIIKFSNNLVSLRLRTNRGDDVLLVKNPASLIIIPHEKDKDIQKIELLTNTILFVKNNQYVKVDNLLGEIENSEKQFRTEIKPILSNMGGEIVMPKLKMKQNFINKNKLLWLLYGKTYQAPINSFLNFYSDHKIIKDTYVFRTKLVNQYPGIVNSLNSEKDIFNSKIELITNNCKLPNSNIRKLKVDKYILNIQKFKYLINLQNINSKLYFNNQINNHFATFATNKFKTNMGGIPYYNLKMYEKSGFINQLISYVDVYKLSAHFSSHDPMLDQFVFRRDSYDNKKPLRIDLSTLLWLPEETYKLNCNENLVLVEDDTFICENFELMPGLFSKTSGIATVIQKNNTVYEIIIRCGLVYEGENFTTFLNKVYYPGETIFNNIKITQPSLCQLVHEDINNQLLIRPLYLYEIPKSNSSKFLFNQNEDIESVLNLKITSNYFYKSNQKIKSANGVDLFGTDLDFNVVTSSQNKNKIEFRGDIKNNNINFFITKNIYLPNYIQASLKYVNINFCKLILPNQFIDSYTKFGYFESIISKALNIVKIKIKNNVNKEILLISNEDCVLVEKEKLPEKCINDLVINPNFSNQIGKVILDNDRFLTIQKGQPYFFPNCQKGKSSTNLNLHYKLLLDKYLAFPSNFTTSRTVFLNYYNITKKKLNTLNFSESKHPVPVSGLKVNLSKMFIKKSDQLYSSLIPIFLQNFSITNSNKNFPILGHRKQLGSKITRPKIRYSTFLKNSEITSNKIEESTIFNDNLLRVQFWGYPFSKSMKIYSLTEDYFQQENNDVFCKNGQFVLKDQTIGLLNFEKEITGDIVQGLPRIEELLEARKKRQISKNIPRSQKKFLVVPKTSIDPNFDFRKLGTSIKETEKINPHNLLKAYFRYYGTLNKFFCDRTHVVKQCQLLNNYEASYKSFKKAQSLILNSVQSVYKSQGVTIADKHLEVIIKQMTTKVIITKEGKTPLLPREVIDLYHMNYINDVVKQKNKPIAFYAPLLLGITKAALNNPSFISAASFQETTNVLTKAAIEGRIDWLRGLKENIIIGHLIPAGTGYQSYRYAFGQKLENVKKIDSQKSLVKNI